jgi:hypothetical protein
MSTETHMMLSVSSITLLYRSDCAKAINMLWGICKEGEETKRLVVHPGLAIHTAHAAFPLTPVKSTLIRVIPNPIGPVQNGGALSAIVLEEEYSSKQVNKGANHKQMSPAQWISTRRRDIAKRQNKHQKIVRFLTGFP